MPRKIERLQWRNVSKKYLRKIILARMCSSTGKCCSFGGASTFQNHRDWLMIAKTKIICRQCSFYLVKNQKHLNCADRRDLMLCEREELLFKGVPTPFSHQNKEIFAQEKLHRMAQHTNFFDKMVKWVAHDTIGALLPIRMTNFSNTKWEHNRNNKRKIWNKKLCCHKWTYCLLLFGNLKYTCCILFGWNFFV